MIAATLRRTPVRIGLAGALVVVLALAIVLFPSPEPTAPPAIRGSLDQVEQLPPGAVACPRKSNDIQGPFNAGARGTPVTSCAFVNRVRQAYSAGPSRPSAQSGAAQISVFSPATGKWYDLACMVTGGYATCTGGVGAIIYLYNE